MPLAKPGDPYVTLKGEVIPSSEPPLEPVSIGPPKASSITSSLHRSITDLPADPKTQTAINVVMVYSVLGLTENEIAHVVGVPLDDIKRLRLMPVYQETFELLFGELININVNSMQSKIAAYAPRALENMMDLADNAENENARVKANQDMLDRGGLHHETLFGKNASDDGFGSLKIVIQEKDDHKTDIEVNLERNKR